MSDCLSANTVSELVEGCLDPSKRTWVSRHLNACTSCSAWVADVAGWQSSGPDELVAGQPVLPGMRIGHYVVLDHLDQGGNADIYIAFDERLERQVALKLARNARPDVVPLLAEATALAAAANPHVITVYDAGHVDGRPYLAMERVIGGSFRQWFEEESRSTRRVQHHLICAGRGLAGAHEVGVVHGDFKPDNVLIAEDGRVLVIDFGLGRFVNDGSGAPRGGTWPYMAPELHRGEPATFESDQFAFAVTCFEALTGVHPFGDPKAAGFRERVSTGRIAAALRWEPWHSIVVRGLAPDPTARHPSMEEMLARLERYMRVRANAPVVVLAATVATGVVAGWPSQRVAVCMGSARAIEQAWGTQQRRDGADAFAATGRAYADDAWKRVAAALDAYTQRWAEQHRDACEATRVRGEQSEERLDQRMTCLEGSRAELAALTHLLAHADERLVATALDRVSSMPDPVRCAHVVEELGGKPALVQRTRGELARASTLRSAGRLQEALEALGAAEQAGKNSGAVALELQIAYERALLSKALARTERAELQLREVLGEATEHDVPELACRAAAVLLRLAAASRRTKDARILVPSARGWCARKPDVPGDARAELHRALAYLAIEEGRADVALAHARTSTSASDPSSPAKRRDAILGLALMGDISTRFGDYASGEEKLRQALHESIQAYGSRHPMTGRVHGLLGNNLGSRERQEESRWQHEQALSIFESAYPPADVSVLQARYNRACTWASQGEYQVAEREFRAILERSNPSSNEHVVLVPMVRRSLALSLLGRGREEEARSELERNIATLTDRPGFHLERADDQSILAALELRQGRHPQAAELFRAVATSYAMQLGPEHPRTIAAWMNAASALSHEDPSRALVLAREMLRRASARSDSVEFAKAHELIGRIQVETGDVEALEHFAHVLEHSLERVGDANEVAAFLVEYAAAIDRFRPDRRAEIRELAQRAERELERTEAPDAGTRAAIRRLLGEGHP